MTDPFAAALPFSLPRPATNRIVAGAAAPFIQAAEELLGLAALNRLYRRQQAAPPTSESFPDRALALLETTYAIDSAALAHIPRAGGVIVVANHPHGALDGLVLASLALRRRPDVRLLGNYLLARIPEIRPLGIFVDPFGAAGAAAPNAMRLREALAWVRDGGLLVVFPAGEVSHARSWRAPVADRPWNRGIARLVEQAAVPVVPVHLSGGNSRLFNAAGWIHPALRTMLLPRELLRQRGRRIAVHVGAPLTTADLAPWRTPASRAAYLRLRTYGLEPAKPHEPASGTTPIARPIAPDILAREIDDLPADRTLLSHGPFLVCFAAARELPHVLLEIGRLREINFRAAGEGTGRARDLDAFDRTYRHLFVWHRERREIAGAYRIGATDDLNAATRPRRLYTRTLFRFSRQLLARLGPALELGRSFVNGPYQRDFGTLMLLWKGIGHIVAANPRYRVLFGPVSISARYRRASRELMAAALAGQRAAPALAAFVQPTRRFEASCAIAADDLQMRTWTEAQLDEVVASIEGTRHGLPILLRQYLRLNATILAFSLDRRFSHVVDGLMLVDLTNVDRPVLQRYLGRDEALRFLAHHQPHADPCATIEPAIASATT